MSAAVGGRGGIERVTTLVIRELRERGHHVELLLFGPSRNSRWEETLAGAYVGPQSKHTRVTCRWLHILWWTFGMVRKFRPDVVIAMTPSAIIVSRLVKLFSWGRYKTWSWLHEAISQLQHTRRLGWADAHLAISSGVGKDIGKTIGRYDNVFVVYNPVVDAPMKPRPGPKDDCHFVYIGRLDNEIKRVEDILRALSCI